MEIERGWTRKWEEREWNRGSREERGWNRERVKQRKWEERG